MNKKQKLWLFILRVSMGWLIFYAGITKVVDPSWSALGYLKGAKSFTGFYNWLVQPGILPVVNFLNEWGLTLIGAALILGVGVRIASILGAAMMLLYYFPILDFPHPDAHSYIVDSHIVYAVALVVLSVFARAEKLWSAEKWFSSLPLFKGNSKLRGWLS